MKSKSRISRITVSRLYNLGNYENCSYSLTVDIPEGASAAKAVRAVEHILAGLAPLRNVFTPEKAEAEKVNIARIADLSADDFQRNYGHVEGGRREYLKRLRASLAKDILSGQARIARARKARDLFDNLGGAEKWKDAKNDWDEDF